MKLNRESIGQCLEEQSAFLKQAKIAPKDALKAELYLEELLLRCLDRFDGEAELSFATSRLLWQSTITLKLKGPQFDPRLVAYEDYPSLFNRLNQDEAYHVSYQYRKGENIIKLSLVPKKNPVTVLFFSLMAGICLGLLLKLLAPETVAAFFSQNVLSTVSKVFIKCVKMLVGPLVFFTIASSIAAYSDLSSLGRMGKKLSAEYLLNALIALAVATLVTLLLKPGVSGSVAGMEQIVNGSSELVEASASTKVTLKSTILGIFPSNFFKAFVDASILQIIFISFLLGVATMLLPDDAREKTASFLNCGNLLFSKMVSLVMMFLPLSVFCSMANAVVSMGAETLLMLLEWLLALLVAFGAMMGIYLLLIRLRTDVKPREFLKKYSEAILGTLAMGSCNSSMPLCMATAEKKLGIDKSLSSFSIPIGVSLHCASNCVFYIISLFFLANLYSATPVSPLDTPVIFLSIFILGIGAPSVSGSGPICVALLLMELGLPAGLISLIIGLDPFVSMLKSACSCIEDAEVMLLLARSEGKNRQSTP